MREAGFAFTPEKGCALMRISMSGFFQEADIRRFVEQRRSVFEQFGRTHKRYATVIDIREMQIQSQESVVGFYEVLHDPTVKSQRIGFIVSQSLARMQILRAADGLPIKLFQDPAAAEKWALADI